MYMWRAVRNMIIGHMRKLQCPLICQFPHIIRNSEQCSSQIRLRGCAGWSGATSSSYDIGPDNDDVSWHCRLFSIGNPMIGVVVLFPIMNCRTYLQMKTLGPALRNYSFTSLVSCRLFQALRVHVSPLPSVSLFLKITWCCDYSKRNSWSPYIIVVAIAT